MIQSIINNPTLVLRDFKAEEIVILKNTLETSAKQILCKYGYMQLDDEGFDKYTMSQIVDRMPRETRLMYWAINNARYLLQIESEMRKNLTLIINQQRAELTNFQMQTIELQRELEFSNLTNEDFKNQII